MIPSSTGAGGETARIAEPRGSRTDRTVYATGGVRAAFALCDRTRLLTAPAAIPIVVRIRSAAGQSRSRVRSTQALTSMSCRVAISGVLCCVGMAEKGRAG